MLRLRLLLPLLVVLALANVAYYTWSRWGLITVNVDDKPLGEVIRSIEKQGKITLRTDLDPATPVKMHVNRVPLTEALETLAAVTDTRWRLTYLFAPDKGALSAALGDLSSSQRPEGWKTIYYPAFGIGGPSGSDEVLPDPRLDAWKIKVPEDKAFQAYVEDAARNVAAAFTFPDSWNPSVTTSLSSGEIRKVAPKLAKAAGGAYEEVFLLRSGRRGPRPEAAEAEPDDANRPPRGPGGFNREAMEQRAQAEINKLPGNQRAEAQREFDERKALFASLADLPNDQRRAKMEEYFSRPEFQERMEDRSAKSDARKTPEQRLKRYKSYVEKKEAVKDGADPKAVFAGGGGGRGGGGGGAGGGGGGAKAGGSGGGGAKGGSAGGAR